MLTVILGCLLVCNALAGYHDEIREKEWVNNDPEPEPGFKPGKLPLGAPAEHGLDNRPKQYVDIMKPKWTPGDILEKTDHSNVDKALGDVLKAGGIMNDRRCAIGIANEGETPLSNPRWWLYSGMIYSSAAYDFQPGQTALNLFVKKDWELSGSVGVLSYDIDGTDYKLAVAFSVPFDFNIYDVWFNMKIYPKSYETSEQMFDQMYYYAGPWRAMGWEERTEFGIHVKGTMTDNIQSKLAVWVSTDGHDPEGSVDIAHDCAYHAGWIGNYCWRECNPRGWCWVNQKCSYALDCQGDEDLPCYSGC